MKTLTIIRRPVVPEMTKQEAAQIMVRHNLGLEFTKIADAGYTREYSSRGVAIPASPEEYFSDYAIALRNGKEAAVSPTEYYSEKKRDIDAIYADIVEKSNCRIGSRVSSGEAIKLANDLQVLWGEKVGMRPVGPSRLSYPLNPQSFHLCLTVPREGNKLEITGFNAHPIRDFGRTCDCY